MIDTRGQSGGLLLLWKSPFDVNVFSYSPGHIDCGVTAHESSWRFTGFYGDPDPTSRTSSWSLLRRLAGLHEFAHLPWVVGGDFNEILDHEEKKCGKKKSLAQIEVFRSAMADCKLEELTGQATGFTWTNKRKGDDAIFARLDHFIVSPAWYDRFMRSRVELLDEYGSDYRALLLRVRPSTRTSLGGGHKRFHFEQKWFFDDSFTSDFLMEWRETGGDCLPARLRKSRDFFTQWAGSRFDSLGRRIGKLRKERIKLLNERGVKDVSNQLNRVSSLLNDVVQKEEVHWRQRSRVNWLAHGDKNTQYFHHHASMRQKRNMIMSLEDEDGVEVSKDGDIAGVVQRYYADLFTSICPNELDILELTSHVTAQVPEHLADIFNKPFIEKEVRKALFQMHPTKSPGPDGFQSVFFQKMWGALGKEVTRECLRILNDGADLEEWNDTYISLIPKVDKPKVIKQYRPISLCNTSYKIISKVIVNRLRRWLPHVIDEAQSAFVPGRLISDNIVVGFNV